jgi:DNA polymerase III delta prime subunit
VAEKKKNAAFLWIEKFRPEKLRDVLLPSKYNSFFKKIVKDGEMPNLILASSSPGTGKTSIAKAICNEMDTEYLFINASNKRGIDVIRTEVSQFAVTKSFTGKKKVVILDESERLTPETQDALKSFLEEVHNTCRFIFTSNNVNKLIEPLRSRCQVFSFDMTTKESKVEMVPKIQKRLAQILTFEEVEFEEETLTRLVTKLFPDIRKMTGLLQQYSMMNGIIDANILNYDSVDEELYDYLENKKFTKARQYILDSGYSFDDLYVNLYRNYVPRLAKEIQGQAIITIAEWQYKSAFSVDKEIAFSAMMLELINIE